MKKKGQIISSINAAVKEITSPSNTCRVMFFLVRIMMVIVLSFFHSIGYIMLFH